MSLEIACLCRWQWQNQKALSKSRSVKAFRIRKKHSLEEDSLFAKGMSAKRMKSDECVPMRSCQLIIITILFYLFSINPRYNSS